MPDDHDNQQISSLQGEELIKAMEEWAERREALAEDRTKLAQFRTKLAEERTALAHQRTELAERRTELADGRTDLANKRTALAEGRTQLAGKRTELAEGRTELGQRAHRPLHPADGIGGWPDGSGPEAHRSGRVPDQLVPVPHRMGRDAQQAGGNPHPHERRPHRPGPIPHQFIPIPHHPGQAADGTLLFADRPDLYRHRHHLHPACSAWATGPSSTPSLPWRGFPASAWPSSCSSNLIGSSGRCCPDSRRSWPRKPWSSGWKSPSSPINSVLSCSGDKG